MSSNTKTRAPKRSDGTFHLIKPKYADNSISTALTSGLITADDKFLIESYVTEAKTSKGFSTGHANKITFGLIRFRNYLGEYRKNTYTDVYRAIDKIKTSPVREKPYEGIPYSQNTLRDFISILKGFYVWLVENKFSDCPLDKILKIKVPLGDTMTKTAEQLLSNAEVLAMINACKNSKDRAFIATLFDGGLRIHEVCTLIWGQIKINESNIVLNTDGKTGIARMIPLVFAKPYLVQWLADYPYETTQDSLVFFSAHGKPMKYGAVRKHIFEIARRAGTMKKVRSHIFRHSRVTDMLRQGYPETVIKAIAWGNKNTKMLETYGHLVFDDIMNVAMEKNGMKVSGERTVKPLVPQQCPHCAMINTPTSNFCSACGIPLAPDAQLSIEELTKEIEHDPIYKAIIDRVKKDVQSGFFAAV
jgi:site-specific recombinase XerD